jgi:hypothetical protein
MNSAVPETGPVASHEVPAVPPARPSAITNTAASGSALTRRRTTWADDRDPRIERAIPSPKEKR